jgi:hypothetical protein
MNYSAIVNGDCNGLSNGSIEIFPTGGIQPYTIDWFDPNLGVDTSIPDGGSSVMSGLTGGVYQVRLNDSNTPDNNEIYINLWISTGVCLNLETIVDASCEGSNGSLSVTATTQNYPVTYSLYQKSGLTNTLITTASTNNIKIFESLPSGIYYVTAVDDGGCSGSTGTCVIKDSGKFTFGLYTIDNSACIDENTGAIYITGLTGTPPYTYEWNTTSENTPKLTGLTSGAYSVTVTDANNCSITKSVIVSTATQLGIINFVNTPPTCFNNDGQIIVNISGGTPPFYYQFSNGENDIDGSRSYTYNNLVAGTYSIIVTDAAFCVTYGTTTILTPNSFTSTNVSVKNSICSNGSGSITVSGAGGQPPYTFQLLDSNGNVISTITASPSAEFSNLNSGTYTVTMTTQGGTCTYTESVVIENTQPFNVFTNPIGTTCGTQNGQVTVYVDTPGIYTYQVGNQIIANSTSQNATFTNLPAGFYNALVSNANPDIAETESCTVKSSFVIPSSTKTAFTLASTSCGNGNEGTVTALITGGNPPYSFGWSANAGSQTGIYLTGLTAGTYSLILTDSDGCVATKSISVNCSSNNTTYSLFNVCDSKFSEKGGTKQGLSQMLNDGYELLTSGDTGCSLTAATFTILLDIGGTGYTSEFYTSAGLLDYPTDTEYITALRNLLDSIPGIGSIIINTESNTIQLSTDCLKALSDKNIAIKLIIDYGFCCDDT